MELAFLNLSLISLPLPVHSCWTNWLNTLKTWKCQFLMVICSALAFSWQLLLVSRSKYEHNHCWNFSKSLIFSNFFRFILHRTFWFYSWKNEFKTTINADFSNLSENFVLESVRIQRYWVCFHIFIIYVCTNNFRLHSRVFMHCDEKWKSIF